MTSALRVVIADAGPLIALARVDHLWVLRELFEEVALCDALAAEVLDGGDFADIARVRAALDAGWMRVQRLTLELPDVVESGLLGLGAGESLSILWALELRAKGGEPLLLMDDSKAREAARRHGLELLGAAKALALARRAGLIERLSPLLETMRADGYYLSQAVVDAALQFAGESK